MTTTDVPHINVKVGGPIETASVNDTLVAVKWGPTDSGAFHVAAVPHGEPRQYDTASDASKAFMDHAMAAAGLPATA